MHFFLLGFSDLEIMSGQGDRLNVFPSRGAQTIMKARLKGAQKGTMGVIYLLFLKICYLKVTAF